MINKLVGCSNHFVLSESIVYNKNHSNVISFCNISLHHKLIMINGLTKVQNQWYEPVVVCHFFMVVLKEFFTSFGQKKEEFLVDRVGPTLVRIWSISIFCRL